MDISVHSSDIEILPYFIPVKIGSGLYDIPALALVVETLYGVFCWWIFRGSTALLVAILAFNLAAISFYVPQIPGPEMLLAGHPKVFAFVILLHIIAGLVTVGLLAKNHRNWNAPA